MKKIFLLFAATTLFIACQSSTSEEAEEANTETAADTQTQDSENNATNEAISSPTNSDEQQMQENSSLNGIISIAPNHHANVTLLMGGTVQSISINPGQYVKKGQVIATLSNPEFVELQQTYLESLAQEEYLKTNYMRQDGLANKGAASQKTQQQSKAEYLSMKSRLDASAARLQQLGINPSSISSLGILQTLSIIAPISGYVADIDVNVGKYLSIGDRICDIVDQSELLLQLNAYEKDLESIHLGDQLTFTTRALPGKEFEATVKFIDQIVDSSNHSIRVFAKVTEGNEQFRTGMYVRARKK